MIIPAMDSEIDNLVKNFKRLWQAGHSAHLDIESHGGQAWMGLRVRLGHAAVPHQHQVHSKGSRNSPSRQRRRIRRAAEREKAAAEVEGNEAQHEDEADAEEAIENNLEKEHEEHTGENKATV